MRVNFWTAALALAACTLVTRGEEEMHARCAPSVGKRCKETATKNTFLIDGQINIFEYKKEQCTLECNHTSLDNDAWPRFPRLMKCSLMVLKNCAPPDNVSYMDVLRSLNVIASDGLEMVFISNDAQLTALSLRDSPPNLQISTTAADGVLELQPGALADISGVASLSLKRVRAHELPTRLKRLTLVNSTSSKGIDSVAAEYLQIKDEELQSLSVPAQNLKFLFLGTPALYQLSIYSGKMEVLLPTFAEQLGQLRVLELDEMLGSLPSGLFLRGANMLRGLIIVNGNLITLPEDLFTYTPKVDFIDLSRNNLISLPAGLFAGLKHLDALLLMNNQLTALSLNPLATLYQLTELNLSDNPLGDLCIKGGRSLLSPLRRLRWLRLARTSLTHLCSDWLRDMNQLSELKLTENYIMSLPCVDLRLARNSSVFVYIDLSDNLITRAVCNREDFRNLTTDPADAQGVTFVLSTPLKCSCSLIWFRLVAQRLRVTIEVQDEPDYCNIQFLTNLNCKGGFNVAKFFE